MEVPDIDINVLQNPSQVSEFWAWLTDPARTYVAADTETTGLRQYASTFKVRMIQFGDTKAGWAIPFQEWRGLVEMAFAWLSRARVKIVWHNLMYDVVAVLVEGIELDESIQTDTYVLAGLGGYAEESRGLKQLGTLLFGKWAGIGASMLKQGMKNAGWTWADVPMDWLPYPLYGVVDTCITAMLWEKWAPRYERWKVMHDLEIATIFVTARMSHIGMHIDVPYLEGEIVNLTQLEATIVGDLKEVGVKPSENASVIAKLDELGLFPPYAPETSTGKPSVAQAVLDRIDHPIAKKVVQYRQVHRMHHNYMTALIEAADSNHLIHADIQPMQAKTGRMSISNPPLQQLPSGTDAVRRAVIPRQPGEVIVSSDWSQIELRMWASMMDDQPLIEALLESDATGLDFFTALCRVLYNDPNFQKADHRRTQVKSSVYAKLFGGGIEVAAETAGVSLMAMTPTWKLLGETFPSLKAAGMNVVKSGPNGAAYVMSPFDRRFAVRTADERRKLPNYLTQGSSAIALKKALVNLRAAGLGDYMVVPVHDEIVFSIPDKEKEDAMAEIRLIMEGVLDPQLWKVPVPAIPGWGATWAEAH